ncbi:GNAT family N-acetyltransferase, partial [Streptomyces albidoflavus]
MDHSQDAPLPDSSRGSSGDTLLIRRAEVSDVAAIVAMLADDPLGATRESPDDLTPYLAAHTRLAADPNQHLVVAERAGKVVGTLQLTLIPGLSRRAATRSLIEGVRVHADERGSGLGTLLIEWAVETARAEGGPRVRR